ncbi:uncharacterized protein IL334_001327 [Kwoniella shivajii]|uniref:Exonuclease V n=1 Tax=Kwoniella shivajii TaxID=564305 RepID=A0ABZ1CRZ4_9TREE|nr:hypothetical protein IL334_001327 [Kwoniella shivajii]
MNEIPFPGNGDSPHSMDVDLDDEDDEYEFGIDIPYDEELELALQAAESQPNLVRTESEDDSANVIHKQVTRDIEDLPIHLGINGLPGPLVGPEGKEEEGERGGSGSGSGAGEVDEGGIERLSPFEQFRKKGYLSVSDLVGPVWCETQYDYRLRTLPFLPPSQRPDIIKSTAGNEIVVNKLKVEDKEKILKRGEKIHKRLEREIHPEEIKIPITTPEDIWGLRFLNMLAALESLLTLGKCRELPVVGFVKGILVYGVIDEIVREPIPISSSDNPDNSTTSQTTLTSFFSPSKAKNDKADSRRSDITVKPKTHKLFVSDSKTRASNVLPKEEDTLAGRLQVMLYKELLDSILLYSNSNTPNSNSNSASVSNLTTISNSNPNAMLANIGIANSSSILPSRNPFSWDTIFDHLHLNPLNSFSEEFLNQGQLVVIGNGLRFGSDQAKTLTDMQIILGKYIDELGLGTPTPPSNSKVKGRTNTKGKGKEKQNEEGCRGKTEDLLKLVYRRAGGKKKQKRTRERKNKRRRQSTIDQAGQEKEGEEPPPSLFSVDPIEMKDGDDAIQVEEERLIQLAITESLIPTSNNLAPVATDGIELAKESDSSMIFERTEEPESNSDTPRPPTRASERIYWGEEEDDDDQKEEDELAWAVEMSLNPDLENDQTLENDLEKSEGTAAVLKTPSSSQPIESQLDHVSSQHPSENGISPSKQAPSSPSPSQRDEGDNLPSGSIIGTHRFTHSPLTLARHLESVLQFWLGEREPSGVTLEETRRCGWCEFEEGCEWRLKKAQEIWEKRKT